MNWTDLLEILAPPLQAGPEGIALYVLLLFFGGVIGLMTGFFGVGGGFLAVPLLNVLIGIDYELAVGSSLSFILGTSFAGVVKQRTRGNIHMATALYIAAGSAGGTVLGDMLQNLLLFSIAGGDKNLFTLWMHSLFILLLLFTLWTMKTKKGAQPEIRQKAPLCFWGPPPRYSLDGQGACRVSIPATLCIGLVIGIMTGLLGIGGGVLLVPILLGLFGLKPQRAAGTSLVVVCIAAGTGIVKKGFSDIPKISLPLTLILLAGSIIGLQIGLQLLGRVRERGFRRYFAYVLFLTILLIAVDLAGILPDYL